MHQPKKNKSNADAVLMIDSPFTAGGAAVARGLDLGKKTQTTSWNNIAAT